MKEVTEEELNELKNSDELTVIKFWAEWCQPCKTIAPMLEEAEEKYPDVNFVSVDIENPDNSQILKDHLIMGVPVIEFVKNGEQVDKKVGVPLKKKIFESIEDNV